MGTRLLADVIKKRKGSLCRLFTRLIKAAEPPFHVANVITVVIINTQRYRDRHIVNITSRTCSRGPFAVRANKSYSDESKFERIRISFEFRETRRDDRRAPESGKVARAKFPFPEIQSGSVSTFAGASGNSVTGGERELRNFRPRSCDNARA